MGARLFSALLPCAEVVASLRRELDDRIPPDPALRWTTARQWHVTLGFYGTDEIDDRAGWLRERLAEAAAPTLWLEGAGTFPGVLWTEVRGTGLAELAAAARPDSEARDGRPYRPHLTLARGGTPGRLAVAERALRAYRSPSWSPSEVVLMRSDTGPEGPRYRTVERFGLAASAS
ncbi:RNA 2',3'-cyclic phosphodiesterase [Qaidamihabitans albus]|uniref:RNA 2',3'-cyclic phosphodiesterase n=1 Tax=Qaidamihabitans albus TaxID=2795733 RepID=UPI0027DAE455|nr:RNA 2',3'-cyclic phosphodiesterase [Qaidamihabitans albus]